MKRFNKLMSLSALLFAMGLASCTPPAGSSSQPTGTSEPEVDELAVNVFVLSSQSNMEGNTSFKNGDTDLIAQAFEELGLDDPEVLTQTGVESVQTSKDMNAVKQEFADSADNNYIVDIYGNDEPTAENELKPGNPGGDNMHYNVKSSLRLGMGYAKVILDNNLLD